MGLFRKMKEPVFLKESNNAELQLHQLKAIEPLLNEDGQHLIRQHIRQIEFGIAGEKNIAYELKNSHMPMYILQDVYLEYKDLSAQIDYLVFTKKICFVIECKNLYGNIEINNNGDFIRIIDLGGKKKKEGIYSPITQNQKHLDLMNKIKTENANNPLTKYMTGRYFNNFYKPVVVLANPKTLLYSKYAPKEIQEKVIRADQLVQFIRELYQKSKETENSDEKLLAWAQSFIKLHKNAETDFTAKYQQYIIQPCEKKVIKKETFLLGIQNCNNETSETDIENTEIYKKLKAYRLDKSREENIKPYIIFNNNQLRDLILKMPKNKKELRTVNGFGDIKIGKYGDDILQIIGNYADTNI